MEMLPATEEKTAFGELFLSEILDFVRSWYDIDELYNRKRIDTWLRGHAEQYGYVRKEDK